MSVVFFGSTALGHACCAALLQGGVDVVGICTMPQHFAISYSERPVRNVTHRSFDDLAERHDTEIVECTNGMSDPRLLTQLRDWGADLAVVVGWYYLLPRRVRALFPLGAVGVHASLLPRYRGGAPLVWAIINGEHETGVSLFYLEDGVDEGDIVAQDPFPIERDDTIATVYERATRSSVRLVTEYIPKILDGSAPRAPQDHSLATMFPQRSPTDGLIDWSRSPDEIRNFIRAQTRPYPGAYTHIDGKRVVIWDADVEPDR